MEPEIRLDPAPGGGGTLFGVRAQPGARRTGAIGTWNGLLKVGVAAPPEDGRANEELLRSLAAILGVRVSSLRLLSGARSRTKRFRVDLDPAACAAHLESVFPPTGRPPTGRPATGRPATGRPATGRKGTLP